MPSLVFSQDSLIGKFVVDETRLAVEFVVSETGIENLDLYLSGVPFGTVVAGIEIKNPFGGGLLFGALYYVENFPKIKFRTDYVNIISNDTIGFVVLNFAYLGVIPLFSNGIFGGDKLTYQFSFPYVEVLAGNPLTVIPTDITTLPIIEVYPNPEPCFLGETNVLTETGYEPVQNLKDGDEIIVLNNGQKTIQKIKKIIKFIGNTTDLYCIPCNSIDETTPNNDLYITGGHAIIYENSLRHVKCLFESGKIDFIQKYQETISEPLEKTYYHIILDNWFDNTIIAEGIEMESYYENSIVNKKVLEWKCTTTDCIYNVKNI